MMPDHMRKISARATYRLRQSEIRGLRRAIRAIDREIERLEPDDRATGLGASADMARIASLSRTAREHEARLAELGARP